MDALPLVLTFVIVTTLLATWAYEVHITPGPFPRRTRPVGCAGLFLLSAAATNVLLEKWLDVAVQGYGAAAFLFIWHHSRRSKRRVALQESAQGG